MENLMSTKQTQLFPLTSPEDDTPGRRDDPVARLMYLSQSVKPAYFIDHPEGEMASIRSFANPDRRLGWVNAEALTACVYFVELFDDPICEEEALEIFYREVGACSSTDDWGTHGWSLPEIELWYEDDAIGVWGGERAHTTIASNVVDLCQRLSWALYPKGDCGDGSKLGWR